MVVVNAEGDGNKDEGKVRVMQCDKRLSNVGSSLWFFQGGIFTL